MSLARALGLGLRRRLALLDLEQLELLPDQQLLEFRRPRGHLSGEVGGPQQRRRLKGVRLAPELSIEFVLERTADDCLIGTHCRGRLLAGDRATEAWGRL